MSMEPAIRVCAARSRGTANDYQWQGMEIDASNAILGGLDTQKPCVAAYRDRGGRWIVGVGGVASTRCDNGGRVIRISTAISFEAESDARSLARRMLMDWKSEAEALDKIVADSKEAEDAAYGWTFDADELKKWGEKSCGGVGHANAPGARPSLVLPYGGAGSREWAEMSEKLSEASLEALPPGSYALVVTKAIVAPEKKAKLLQAPLRCDPYGEASRNSCGSDRHSPDDPLKIFSDGIDKVGSWFGNLKKKPSSLRIVVLLALILLLGVLSVAAVRWLGGSGTGVLTVPQEANNGRQ